MSRINHKELIGKIRNGKEPSGLKPEDVSRYYSALEPDIDETVSESTWVDLNMDEVFLRVNRTVSAVGAQYLYRRMHSYGCGLGYPEDQFKRYAFFQKNHAVSDKLSKILLGLRGSNASFISNVLFGKLPAKPVWFPILFLMPLILISAVAGLVFVSKEFILLVLASAVINTVFQQVISMRISSYIPNMGSLGRMLNVSASLADTGESSIKEIEVLCKHRRFVDYLHKKFGWILIDTGSIGELSASVIAYVNNLLLVNLIVFYSAAKHVEMHRKELTEVFEAIGSLDATMAVASHTDTVQCCCPQLNNRNHLETVSLYHPLLENPVSNSFTLSAHSCLITGSNMAGKTTFIKTIGVNLLLARTLGICHAESAQLPVLEILSTIRRRDDLKHGKSYYYVEIETILEFIKAADSGRNCLFLIDEIFRGTNTLERLSASSAVLSYLSDNCMVMVTTHDIELEKMLSDKFTMYHFQEQIEEGKHFFDYRIKPGPCSSRNAIRLLALTGYPSCITEKAHKISKQLALVNYSEYSLSDSEGS